MEQYFIRYKSDHDSPIYGVPINCERGKNAQETLGNIKNKIVQLNPYDRVYSIHGIYKL